MKRLWLRSQLGDRVDQGEPRRSGRRRPAHLDQAFFARAMVCSRFSSTSLISASACSRVACSGERWF
ncbi:MAG: hypothetical protein R2717_02240 [Schumannella sp.]